MTAVQRSTRTHSGRFSGSTNCVSEKTADRGNCTRPAKLPARFAVAAATRLRRAVDSAIGVGWRFDVLVDNVDVRICTGQINLTALLSPFPVNLTSLQNYD